MRRELVIEVLRVLAEVSQRTRELLKGSGDCGLRSPANSMSRGSYKYKHKLRTTTSARLSHPLTSHIHLIAGFELTSGEVLAWRQGWV